jgi:UDP-N-acetylmuramate: L-alanyl-gamma-D-glutamyl-meso-diaminopimelate ligase
MRPDYPEVLALRARDLPAASMAEALADVFLADALPIVISGTHGKTTTASMTAWILHEAGLDPSFFIGGLVAPWFENHRLTSRTTANGQRTPFVIEGDEYDTAFFDKDSKFHHYRPEIAALNNIEFDHADIFPNLDAIIDTFRRFAARVPAHGLLVAPLLDANVRAALADARAPVLTTAIDGIDPDAALADVRATNIMTTAEGTSFELHMPDNHPVTVRLGIPGVHNVRNALVAATLAHRAGVTPERIAPALGSFALPLRRLTLRHTVAGVPILDDFAHHPTAIRATLAAVRAAHPGRRIVALFEVQSNTARRRVFQDAFAEALATADRVWFSRPLVKGSDPLPPEQRLDLPALADAIRAAGVPATIIEDIDALAEAVAADTRPSGDVIVAMSGRHFDGIHDRIAARLTERQS